MAGRSPRAVFQRYKVPWRRLRLPPVGSSALLMAVPLGDPLCNASLRSLVVGLGASVLKVGCACGSAASSVLTSILSASRWFFMIDPEAEQDDVIGNSNESANPELPHELPSSGVQSPFTWCTYVSTQGLAALPQCTCG